MDDKIDIQKLAILTVILFIGYYIFIEKKEKLENTENKACSQKAINDGYLSYIFGSVQSTR
jgi:hypothetical protein